MFPPLRSPFSSFSFRLFFFLVERADGAGYNGCTFFFFYCFSPFSFRGGPTLKAHLLLFLFLFSAGGAAVRGRCSFAGKGCRADWTDGRFFLPCSFSLFFSLEATADSTVGNARKRTCFVGGVAGRPLPSPSLLFSAQSTEGRFDVDRE